MPDYTQGGTFVAPTAIEIDSISQLVKENFGPILHVIRYKTEELDDVIDSINGTGYGLTFGIHSRNETLRMTSQAALMSVTFTSTVTKSVRLSAFNHSVVLDKYLAESRWTALPHAFHY